MNIQSVSASLPQQSNPEASAVSRAAHAFVASPAQENSTPAQPVGQEQLKAAVSSVREYIQPFNNNLEFSINDETHQLVVKVVDSETKEVIRQIPSEEMLAIAKALDSIKGLLFKQKA
ncbi:MAG: flagellar protein FlaG [Propionivibrio sp.]|uniref:flagellar protein FlaG n=1 Tax=Propionivibrio sp. TaxID=2212460 RepID=UPI0025E1120E|nr:flagellar protein FlaG [Propionivibrio sp.]MBL0207797.1 flagellar protein FlaG [Propionivibrio sp.]